MKQPMTIAVLMGGISSEREVSLMSGKAVADALESRGHNVLRIDVTDRELSTLVGPRPDVVFIALHGFFGEDGGVQSVLESKGLRYAGSGINPSKLAMNKPAAKEIFMMNNIPTPEYIGLRRASPKEALLDIVRKFGLPVVAKPAAEGSSLGVSIIRKEDDIEDGLSRAFQHGDLIMLERYIEGREITVGILGDRPLPVIELVPDREFYDYDAKYLDDHTRYELSPDLDRAVYEHIQQVALAAHNVLGCSDFSRVDMRLSTTDQPYVLEVNTIPGFTSHSLLPKAAQAAGIDFPELCERIVEMALSKVEV